MKRKKKFIFLYFAVLLFILLVIFSYFLLTYPKACNYDEKCFQENFVNCKRARVYKFSDGNLYEFIIVGKRQGKCGVVVKAIDIPNPELKEKLENKKMTCLLDTSYTINEIPEMLDYCTGPLKEALLEIMLKRFYEIFISNLQNITQELEKAV